MKIGLLKTNSVSTGLAIAMSLGLCTLARAESVELEPAQAATNASQTTSSDTDSNPAGWTRQLWTGSFDRAADASGAAAKRLENMDYGDCQRYLTEAKGDPQKAALYQACVKRSQDSKAFASEAHSIQNQQNIMSLISKTSDVAAVGAVGAVAYAELGMKQGNQADSYQSAANVEQTAGYAAYATGATDLTLAAWAYAAQKQKFEQMKNTITNSADGAQLKDPAVASALNNASEAAQKAAMSHLMWGAGKVAAGYGMMYLSQRTQNQAAMMQSMEDMQEQNMMMQQMIAANNANGAASTQQAASMAQANYAIPYYQNNTPTFALPNSTGTALSPSAQGTGTTGLQPTLGSSTGGSVAPLGAMARAPASISGKGAPASGGGSGDAAATGDASAAAAPDGAKDKTTKEALGSSFEVQLNGGVKPYNGNSAGASPGGDMPNLASLLNSGAPSGGSGGSGFGATGLNPAQIFRDAQEGSEDAEQGSMAGVSGKSETSLFDITKQKLLKMFQTGNIGIPKNVEVKN